MFRKMFAVGCLVTSLMAFSGPAFAMPGVGDLADPRPSPAVDVTDLVLSRLADPRPSPIIVK